MINKILNKILNKMLNKILKKLRGRDIGKYIILICFGAFAIFSIYKVFDISKQKSAKPEYGVVVGRNDAMTSGKYPKQQFIIAFKFDNPEYGTQDINVTFSTWNSFKVGDRSKFTPDIKYTDSENAWMLCGVSCMFILACFILFCILALLVKLWRF